MSDFKHRELRSDEFWKQVPAWKNVTREEFGNHSWQLKNSVRKIDQIQSVLGSRIQESFVKDMLEGQKITPMNIRITPYIFALMNWDDPVNDPLRKQFLPIGSEFLPDHPFYMKDSLGEEMDSPVPQITHRYPDKVLFLTIAICPVYCAYCTRSRLIGGSTETVEKDSFGANPKKWEVAFDYIRSNPAIEDVIISGGDIFMLTAKQIQQVGETLLKIPHVRRIRYATKGIAVWPQKILTDDVWFKALNDVHKFGRSLGKQVVIHTHFSSPIEITEWSKMAMDRLFAEGIIVRNQAVLQEGVNNSIEEMVLLTKKVGWINIQPYYVYLHDMVGGCEHLRTTLQETITLEKNVRGITAGFNTPAFVCDAPGGGGKRNIASAEYYDRENGISVWTAPNVKPGKVFTYFDPIHKLSPEAQKRWADPKNHDVMVSEAIKKAGV